MGLKTKISLQNPLCGFWVSLLDPTVPEIVAELEYDFVIIDIEHTPLSLETVVNQVRAVDAANSDTEVIVRLSWNDPVLIKRVLDTGASGIMAPMIDNETDAEALVAASTYPPEGNRGVAGSRPSRYGLDRLEYYEEANERIIRIAQIESRAGSENVREIANVDGIDAIFIGKSDLSANLGIYGEWDNKELEAVTDNIIAQAHSMDTPVAAIALKNPDIVDSIERGYDLLVVGLDRYMILDRANQRKSKFQESITD